MDMRRQMLIFAVLAFGVSCGGPSNGADGDGGSGGGGDLSGGVADGGGGGGSDGGGGGSDGGTTTPASSAVLTYHNDNGRTGAQLTEKTLTPSAIAARGMHLAMSRPVDGPVQAQLLYAPGVDVGGTPRNLILAQTNKATIYAYDADDRSGFGTDAGLVWKTHLTDPESTTRIYVHESDSTPAIDLSAREIHVLYSTSDTRPEPLGESTVDVAFWVTTLDLATGAIKRRAKISAEARRPDGTTLPFLPRNHRSRPALLLDHGHLYLGFGARPKEGQIEYHGWVVRLDAATLEPRGMVCLSPGTAVPRAGAGIWQGGAGFVADENGSVFLMSGNGDFAPPSLLGNAFLRLDPTGSSLVVAGAWKPYDPENKLQLNDVDIGSGGPARIPGTRRIAGAGKTGILYLMNADGMGAVQEVSAFHNVYDPTFPVDSNWEGGPHIHGTPVVWQTPDPDVVMLYGWAENDVLRAYPYRRSRDRFDEQPAMQGTVRAVQGVMPGGQMSLSADGSRAGTAVLWAFLVKDGTRDARSGEYLGRLLAYDAETLDLLWETDFPTIPKWMPPTIADGKVLVPTSSNELQIYELN
jgi:hypothetical protein